MNVYSGHNGSNNYHTKLGLGWRRKQDYEFPLDDP